jgi:ferredoxin
MIVAERKPIEKIEQMLEPYEKILMVGCGMCVAVCMAGGEKEVQILAEQLRMKAKMNNRKIKIDEVTITRQCDMEYLDQLEKYVGDYDAVLSTACGAGVQYLSERYDTEVVFPALNTRFIGVALGAGQWSERCRACANCVLDQTGGICPITVCPKSIVNGPCGGTNHGKCEVDEDKDCAWTLIYNRLEKTGRLDLFKVIQPAKDFSVSTTPGNYSYSAYNESAEDIEDGE